MKSVSCVFVRCALIATKAAEVSAASLPTAGALLCDGGVCYAIIVGMSTFAVVDLFTALLSIENGSGATCRTVWQRGHRAV